MAAAEEAFADRPHTIHHIKIDANGKTARGLAVEMSPVLPTLTHVTRSPYADGMILLETPLPDAYTPNFTNYS